MTPEKAPGGGTVRRVLFLASGLALPLGAFRVPLPAGKAADLATLLALLCATASIPALVRNRERLPRGWLALAVTAPLPALATALVPPFSHAQFAFSYAHWLLMAGLFVSVSVLPLEWRDLARFAAMQSLIAAAVAAFALYQVAGIPRGWPATGALIFSFQAAPFRFGTIGSFLRPTSIFLEPGWLGGYLAWTSAVTAAALASGLLRGRAAPIGWASLALGLPALAATVSWGGYVDGVAALGGVVLGILASRGAGRRRVAIACLLGAALLWSASLSPAGVRVREAVVARFRLLLATPLTGEVSAGLPVDSTRTRLDNAADALLYVKLRPVTGIGIGQFGRFQGEYLHRPSDVSDPWSGWLDSAAEMGPAGPIVLLVALLLAARRRPASTFGRLLRPGATALLLVQPLHAASYISLTWWFPAAFLLAALRVERDGEAGAESARLRGQVTPGRRPPRPGKG